MKSVSEIPVDCVNAVVVVTKQIDANFEALERRQKLTETVIGYDPEAPFCAENIQILNRLEAVKTNKKLTEAHEAEIADLKRRMEEQEKLSHWLNGSIWGHMGKTESRVQALETAGKPSGFVNLAGTPYKFTQSDLDAAIKAERERAVAWVKRWHDFAYRHLLLQEIAGHILNGDEPPKPSTSNREGENRL